MYSLQHQAVVHKVVTSAVSELLDAKKLRLALVQKLEQLAPTLEVIPHTTLQEVFEADARKPFEEQLTEMKRDRAYLNPNVLHAAALLLKANIQLYDLTLSQPHKSTYRCGEANVETLCIAFLQSHFVSVCPRNTPPTLCEVEKQKWIATVQETNRRSLARLASLSQSSQSTLSEVAANPIENMPDSPQQRGNVAEHSSSTPPLGLAAADASSSTATHTVAVSSDDSRQLLAAQTRAREERDASEQEEQLPHKSPAQIQRPTTPAERRAARKKSPTEHRRSTSKYARDPAQRPAYKK